MFKQFRRERAQREQRLLLISAAATQGGKAFEMLLQELDRELAGARAEAAETAQSQMPLNQEQFEAWLKNG